MIEIHAISNGLLYVDKGQNVHNIQFAVTCEWQTINIIVNNEKYTLCYENSRVYYDGCAFSVQFKYAFRLLDEPLVVANYFQRYVVHHNITNVTVYTVLSAFCI